MIIIDSTSLMHRLETPLSKSSEREENMNTMHDTAWAGITIRHCDSLLALKSKPRGNTGRWTGCLNIERRTENKSDGAREAVFVST